MEIHIRDGNQNDIDAFWGLYKNVSAVEGGIARTKDEITKNYVEQFVTRSINNGIILLAEEKSNKEIVGAIHCYSPGIKVFNHVLGELTIVIHPEYRGMKIGRMLFEKLLNIVTDDMPGILRVELIARESNIKAIKFYESLGFKIEGRFEKRIKSVGGGYEADIPMAWLKQ